MLIIGVALGVGMIAYSISRRLPQDPVEAADARAAVSRATRPRQASFRPRPAPSGETRALGPEPARREGGSERFGSVIYVPILHVPDPEWRTRLGAALGLMLLVTAAALVLAVAIYRLGLAVNGMIQGSIGS